MLRIFKSKTFNQFKTLVFGSSYSFLIQVVALYYYSKFFNKEQFGLFALFVSTINITAIIASLRVEDVIILQKTKKDAAYIVSLSRYLIKIFSSSIGLLSILLVLFSISFFQSFSVIWILIAINIYFIANINVLLHWNNKIKKYKLISNYRLVNTFLVSVLGIVLGYFKFELGLIIAFSIGSLVSYIYLFVKFKEALPPKQIRTKFKDIYPTLYGNKDIINYSFGLSLIFTVMKSVPNFILNSFYGNGIVGIYDMCLRVLNIPRRIFSQNIGELYFQKGSIFFHKNRSKFNKITNYTIIQLFVIGVLCYLPFVFFGSELFSFFLGNQWLDSGKLSEFIVFWYIIIFITTPMSYIFYIERNLKTLFIFSLFSILLKISILVYFANFKNAFSTIAIYTSANFFIEIILLYLIVKRRVLIAKK